MTSTPQSTTLTLYGWGPHSSVVAQLLRSPAISRDLQRSRAISCDLPRSPEIRQSEVAPLAPSQRFRAGPPPGGNPPSSSDQLPSQSLPASLSLCSFSALRHVAQPCVFFSRPPAPPMGLRRCPDRRILVSALLLRPTGLGLCAVWLGQFACTALSLSPFGRVSLVCGLAQPESRTSPRSSHSNARDRRAHVQTLACTWVRPASLACVCSAYVPVNRLAVVHTFTRVNRRGPILSYLA